MKEILLIEDDTNLAFMMIDGLEREGFKVHHITSGEELLAGMPEFNLLPPDIILLDVNLNGTMNGFEISNRIRDRSQVPIIFTTARTQIEDIQQGFKVGNVDYLKKPFGIRELILRINELLSRQVRSTENSSHNHKNDKTYQLGNYHFLTDECILLFANEKIHLPKNECTFLKLLCENIDQVVIKNDILSSIWLDEDLKQKEPSMNNILSSLRSKLSRDKCIEIQTIPKTGYKLIVTKQ